MDGMGVEDISSSKCNRLDGWVANVTPPAVRAGAHEDGEDGLDGLSGVRD